jgi:hypothetical protein
MKKLTAICALLGAMLMVAPRPSYAFLDKTRFATDLGVAFFAFHHWVLTPYKNGAFAAGAPHRTAALVKGGAALLFAVNRVKAAENIANNSKSPTLQALIRPIHGMEAAFAAIGTRLKGGAYKSGDVSALDDVVKGVGTKSSAAGLPINDVAMALPSGN